MPTADTILKNASIITMDSRRPRAEAVAVRGDTICMVGGSGAVEALKGAATQVIDCGGRTVVPGFNDAHLHLFSLIKKLLSVDISLARSIADIKEAVRKKAAKTPPGKWISGTDYNEFSLAEKRCPTRWDLDEAAPDHPVILSHRSLHACLLNSMALERAGIHGETPEPPGARIERDLETGEPNGILINMLSYIRSGIMPAMTAAELKKGVALADKLFLSSGITSVQDATVNNDTGRWETVCSFILNRQLKSRMTMMAGSPYRTEFQERGLKTGAGDNLMRVGAVKFILEIKPDQDTLNEQALACHQAGWQIAFHAVAEKTIEAAVAALEYADKHSPVAGRRHRIEHCSECPPYLLRRLRKLEAVIVTHPATVYYNGERYLVTVPASQLPWLYRIKSPMESGLVVAAASDAPVIPVNPMAGIYEAVTRKAESGQVLLPEEAVTVEQALAMYTLNAAYTSFEEDIKGSITPGKLADMAVLSGDPTKVPVEEIKDIEVMMTIVGGEVAWES